jgi:hydrogenase expression/formation protein HypE
VLINEDAVEIRPGVRGACDLLGLDPFYIANEGILVAFAAGRDAGRLVEAMRKTEAGKDSIIIGEVVETPEQTVLLKTKIGGIRILDMLSGDQLPRIC